LGTEFRRDVDPTKAMRVDERLFHLIMLQRVRKREMKGYDCDVAVDAPSGIHKVHLVGLSRKSARLDRSLDPIPHPDTFIEAANSIDDCPVRVH
jgi:hypothetical protein